MENHKMSHIELWNCIVALFQNKLLAVDEDCSGGYRDEDLKVAPFAEDRVRKLCQRVMGDQREPIIRSSEDEHSDTLDQYMRHLICSGSLQDQAPPEPQKEEKPFAEARAQKIASYVLGRIDEAERHELPIVESPLRDPQPVLNPLRCLELLVQQLDRQRSPRDRLLVILDEATKLPPGFDSGEISILDRTRDVLKVIARTGKPGASSGPYLLPASVGITGRVIRTGEPVILSDIRSDPDFQALSSGNFQFWGSYYTPEYWEQYQSFIRRWQSCIKIPLKNHNREVVGAFCLHANTKKSFPDDIVNLLCSLHARFASAEISHCLKEETVPSHSIPLSTTTYREPEVLSWARYWGAREGERPQRWFPTALGNRDDKWKEESSGRKLERLARELTARIREETGAFRAAVRLLDYERKSLTVVGHVGDWEQCVVDEDFELEQDSAGSFALNRGDSYFIPDTSLTSTLEGNEWERLHFKVLDGKAKAHASVIIRDGCHVLGVVSIDWGSVIPFDCSVRKTLERLVAEYAGAIKAYLADIFLALVDDMFLDSGTDEDSELDCPKLLKTVAQMIGARQGAIFLRSRDTGLFELQASLLRPELVGKSCSYQPGQGITGWILKHNRPVRVANLRDRNEIRAIYPEDPPVWKDHLPDGEKHNSYLGVPISVGDEVFGVLRLGDMEHGFINYDQQIVVAAASRLAGFLFQREQKRKAAALTQIAATISTTRAQKELAEAVFPVLGSVLGPSFCSIRLCDSLESEHGTQQTVLRRLTGNLECWNQKAPLYREAGDGIAGKVLRTKQLLFLSDSAQDEEVQKLPFVDEVSQELLRSFGTIACAPLTAGPKFIGTLLIGRKNSHAMSHGDLHFLKEVGKLLGQALQKKAEEEEGTMKKELLEATNSYWTHVAQGDNHPHQERELLHNVCNILRKAFDGIIVCAWSFDSAKRVYRIDDESCNDLPQSLILRKLPDNSSIIIAEPERDHRLKFIIETSMPDNSGDSPGSCGVIPLGSGGEPVALFFVSVGPTELVSFTRFRQAREMLQALPIQIILGRQYASSSPWSDSISIMPKGLP